MQAHKTLRGTWLEVMVATGPKKKGEVGKFLGHPKVITGVRVNAEGLAKSQEKKEEAIVSL